MMVDESSSQLIALTSHFAQVQFRLKQILASPRDQREDLLDELGRFAFKGCPGKLTYDTAAEGEKGSTEQQRVQLSKLTSQLHDQLAELEEDDEEEVLYDGSSSPRSPLLLRKQDAALQEIKRKFDLEFPNLESLSVEEVKEKVGQAIDEVAQPTQSKNLTVRYLAQQVRSMEQHISLLQEELAQFSATASSPVNVLPEYSSGGTREVQVRYSVQWGQDLEEADEEDHLLALHQYSSDESVVDHSSPSRSRNTPSREQHGVFVLRKTIALMQVLTLWQCGGSFKCLPKPVTHYNTKFQASVRALELAVDKITVIMGTLSQPNQTQVTISHLEVDLHEAVSMQLADSLRELIEHGLESVVSTESLSCLSPFSWLMSQGKHAVGDCPAWQVLKHFYQLKKGPVVCSKPENRLISSFCLPMETTASIKKTFLNTIHSVEGSFATCRNYSPDIKFRALICQGFNLRHLSDWFRQLATHPSLVDELYRPTAFMAATGFKPALQCMDKLRTTQVVVQVNLPASYYHHVNTFNH